MPYPELWISKLSELIDVERHVLRRQAADGIDPGLRPRAVAPVRPGTPRSLELPRLQADRRTIACFARLKVVQPVVVRAHERAQLIVGLVLHLLVAAAVLPLALVPRRHPLL